MVIPEYRNCRAARAHDIRSSMTSALERRLVALEVQRRPAVSYVVRLPGAALADPAARYAAIMEHRQRTGWMWPVILAPLEMTTAEWIATYGRAST